MRRLELGHVSKAHGLRGDLILHLTTDRVERTAPGAELFLGRRVDETDRFVVKKAQPYQSKWLVSLEGIESREAADELRGRTVFGDELDAAGLEDDAVFVHLLIGKRLVDQHGTDHGPVVSVIDNPAADLLELDDGRLVPLNFYVSDDDERIIVDVPVGLLDDEAEEAR